MYNFSLGGSSGGAKKDPYNFSLGGSDTKQKGFGLTGSLSKTGGLTGGLTSASLSSASTSVNKKASTSLSSGFGGSFGDTKSIANASKSAQAASSSAATLSSKSKPSTATASSSSAAAASKISKKGSKSKFGEDIIPKRFGLRYDPPTIIMEYLVNSGKLYHHKMKLRKLQKDTSPKDAIEYLRTKHETYLSDPSITDDQLASLVERLKKHVGKQAAKPSEPLKKSNSLTPIGGGLGSSKATSLGGSSTAASSLSAAGGGIRASSAKPASSVYSSISGATSKPSYLAKPSAAAAAAHDDSDEEEEDNYKYAWNQKGPASIAASKSTALPSKTGSTSYSQSTIKQAYKPGGFSSNYGNDYEEEEDEEEEEEDQEEDEDDDQIDYQTYNLNKLDNDQLQKHKDKMENLFKQNSLKPGDKGYQYEVEEEFNPEESNDWDD